MVRNLTIVQPNSSEFKGFSAVFQYEKRKEMKQWKKDSPDSLIWWLEEVTEVIDDDDYIFSFDKKKRYHLFGDYPAKLTPKEKEIFDKEYPFWRRYLTGE